MKAVAQNQPERKSVHLLLLSGRIMVAGIFIFAAYSKIRPLSGLPWSMASLKVSLAMFATLVDGYQILPPWGVSLVAHVLPFVELGLGVWLIVGVALCFSASLSALAIFTFVMGQMSAVFAKYARSLWMWLIPGEQIGPLSLTIDAPLLLVCLAIAIDAFRSRNRVMSSLTGVEPRVD